jgi:hypothetical protein
LPGLQPFPEPFGFYVLEPVFHGCPVYTNAIRNNRFLLPPQHGIVVDQTLAMTGAMVDAQAYRHVAARVYEDLADPAGSREDCARGAGLMRSRWSRRLRRSLEALARGDSGSGRAHPFEELVVSLSPLVRHFDPSSGRCLNGYADTVLKAEEVAAMARILGRRCADLDPEEMCRLEERHGLFRRGMLALVSPDQAATSASARCVLVRSPAARRSTLAHRGLSQGHTRNDLRWGSLEPGPGGALWQVAAGGRPGHGQRNTPTVSGEGISG